MHRTDLLMGRYAAMETLVSGVGTQLVVARTPEGAASVLLLGHTSEALAAESALPGFALQPPKPESEPARAGVRGGDRLLAVDGQEVRSVRDIQIAIRKHALGEEVRLLVQRGSQPAGEIVVRHVSDCPET